jgi:hypothetical protein
MFLPQYISLIDEYMHKYDISFNETRCLIKKHKWMHYLKHFKIILLRNIAYLVYNNIWM